VGYILQGVIGSAGALRPGRALAHTVVVPLTQGLCLLPMTQDLFDEVRRGDRVDPRLAPCQLFPPGFERVLAEWSQVGPLALEGF
jgi:hypothetical protein